MVSLLQSEYPRSYICFLCDISSLATILEFFLQGQLHFLLLILKHILTGFIQEKISVAWINIGRCFAQNYSIDVIES
jgi:hypothetical protein